MTSHELYMHRCIELARNGLGAVSPNPMVGCVIVYNDKIIGEGYHIRYGDPHAEVNAINSVKDKNLLCEAILYVNLEPCSHHGKTPPCADLIIKHKIPTVFIGSIDPFDQVAGNGIRKLKQAGCNVSVQILESACMELNKRFFTFHKEQRPYIILKWAQTKDGFIDKERTDNKPEQNWITNKELRVLSHKWRAEEDGIAIGTNTAQNDDPQLNIRQWTGYDPTRILFDNKLRLSKDLHIFDNTQKTIILNTIKDEVSENTEYLKIDFDKELTQRFCQTLHNKNIQSVIIEGGRQLLQTFIDAGLWDEARVFVGDKKFKQGMPAPSIQGKEVAREFLSGDEIIYTIKE